MPKAMKSPRRSNVLELLPTSLLLIVHGVPGKVVMGGYGYFVLDLIKRIVEWLPDENRKWLQHVHLDSCKALVGVTENDKKRHPSIQHITLTGFTVNTDVASGQLLGQKFLRYISRAVEETDPAQWQQHGLSANVLRRAKAKLQDAVGRAPPHVGPSGPDAVVSDERSLVSDLQVI